MQRTITVNHEGEHEPSSHAIGVALAAELKKEKLTRVGDYTVQGSTIVSGGPSTLTLNFDAEETKSAAKSADSKK